MAGKVASVVSAEDLHDFGNFLMRSRNDMFSLISGIVSEVDHINGVWDDKVNRKFTEDFKEYLKQVASLIALLDDHSLLVHKKAAAIEHYDTVR